MSVSDCFIYWNEDPYIRKELSERQIKAKTYPFALEKSEDLAAYIENELIKINTGNRTFQTPISELTLRGQHNMYNSMAAGITAVLANISDESIREAFRTFKGAEHRLERVANVKGVTYINDSKATNVNSCWYALQSMTTPVVLILGGKDKGNDYTEIEALVKEKVSALICLGVDNSKLHAFFDGKVSHIEDAGSMKEAVEAAYRLAKKGDTVLLSPCCASFDLFKSYEDRGTQFKEMVKSL